MTKTVSCSTLQTKAIAKKLARDVVSGKFGDKQGALVVALSGELGAGKTVFVQGFARALGIQRRVVSPTFVFVRRYFLGHRTKDIGHRMKYTIFFHIDAYRVRGKNDVKGLGLREIFAEPRNLVLVEWAEDIRGFLPKDVVWVRMRHGEHENHRVILISNL